MLSVRRLAPVAAVAFVATSAVGCRLAASLPGLARPGTAVSSRGSHSDLPIADVYPEKSTGPGLMICQTVAAPGVDAAAKAFAAGCTHWLIFTVCGQPELGRTPVLTSFGRARRELRLDQYGRLTPEDARRAARLEGVTYYVTSAVRDASGGSLALEYQAYRTATGEPVGKAVTAEGTPDAVRSAMPKVAATLLRSFGVTAEGIPAAVDATRPELEAIGRAVTDERAPADPLLRRAAGHSAIAAHAVLLGGPNGPDPNADQDIRTLLTRLAPNNAAMWAQVGYWYGPSLQPYADRLAALRRRYPHNFALAYADMMRCHSASLPEDELRAAEDAARSAPENPDAWFDLGWTVGNQCANQRRGRFSGGMSAEETRRIDSGYALWEAAMQKAVDLDPQHETAWRELCQAATFAGDMDVANDALAKAETYTLDKTTVYTWGLQMYQDKWYPDKDRLDMVADHASKADYTNFRGAGEIAKTLQQLGYARESFHLVKRLIRAEDDRIARNPGDGDAHWAKAILLRAQNNAPDSLREYRAAARLLPTNAGAQFDCADALFYSGHREDAIPYYRRALERDPGRTAAMVGLGASLYFTHRYAEAAKWLTAAVKRDEANADAHYRLGELYEWGQPARHAEAAREMKRALDLGDSGPETYAGLTYALTDAGQVDEAIRWGEEGADLYAGYQYVPIQTFLHAALGYAYLAKKRYADAVRVAEAGRDLTPRDWNVHQVLGDAYFGLGRRADARRSWAIVAAGGDESDPASIARAKADLAKYPENGK